MPFDILNADALFFFTKSIGKTCPLRFSQACHLLLPTPLYQGTHATALFGKEMSILGLSGPVLIVTSKSPRLLLEATCWNVLGDAGNASAIYDFPGEGTAVEVERIAVAAKKEGAETIKGVGGGKTLDAARAAVTDLALPFVSCPTIASTDAPCSAISIIYMEAGVVERGVSICGIRCSCLSIAR